MKLLITIMSSLLFMLQIPIQAVDELDNNPQSTTTSTSDINNIINIYKIALENLEKDDILSIANDLLDNFVETKDFKIINTLLLKDKDDNTFLHMAALDNNRAIIQKTINVLKDEHKELFEKLLLSSNASGKTFLHMAALDRNRGSLRITINALIEDKQIALLEKLLSSTDNSGGTFLHSTAESPSGYLPDIIKITSDVFKNNHSHFLKRLLMSVDNSGHTFLHRSAVLGNNKTDDVHQTLKQNLDAQFIDDTQLFSLKNRTHYKILHIIKNTKQLIKEVIITTGYLF